MSLLKTMSMAGLALALMSGTASAVTIKNVDSSPHKIGIDRGNTESVETVGAGKSLSVKCPDGCGFTGPWGFSWMAKGDDVIKTDGKSYVDDYTGFKGQRLSG